MALSDATRLADFATGVGTDGTLDLNHINSTGIVTAVSFSGSGSGLTGLPGQADFWIKTAAGINTTVSVGIGTTRPDSISRVNNTSITNVGILTAYQIYGDGSNLSGISTAAVPGISTQLHSVFGTVNASGIVTASAFYGSGANLTNIDTGVAGVNTTGFSTFKDVSVQGITTFSNLTDSSSTTTGALVISGGVGIAKSMYIGGNIAFADGQGIDFSATSDGTGTMSSEVLDDYEYGTWTPDMDNGTYTSSPSPLINATYVKIGHFVFVNAAYKNVSQFTSTANSTHFHDVPFNANDQAAGSACQANVGDLGSVLVNGSTWYLPTVDYDNNVNFTCVYNV